MNPAVAAQLFAAQSPFSTGIGRPTPAGLDPATAALLLDPRYRSMIPSFANPSSSSLLPPPPSSSNNSSSSSGTSNGTHNHAHIHSHSHTHLHLGNTNDPSPSNPSNGSPFPPPPPLLPFGGKINFLLSISIDFTLGLSHGNHLLHPGGPLPPPNLEALHNSAREREQLMAFILANNGRLDPMALALANSFQVCVHFFLKKDMFKFCFRCHVMMNYLELMLENDLYVNILKMNYVV
jgi:hypothetical protein